MAAAWGLEWYAGWSWGVDPRWYSVVEADGEVRLTCQLARPVAFTPQPAEGVTRILLIGGSSTFGSPERPNGDTPLERPRHGFVGVMQAGLDRTVPGRFELLNLGVNGGSSQDSLRLLRKAVDWGASAVVIYDGHNEFMATPARFHAWAWGSALYRRLTLWLPRPTRSPGWVGAPANGSEAHTQAILALFEHNLDEMVELAEHHGMTVVLSTQASNLVDFDPTWSTSGDEAALGRLQHSSLGELASLAARFPDSADIAWHHGRRLLSAGADGRSALIRARDHDGLPFRGTTALNDIIRAVGDAHGAVVVDAELAASAGGKPPGNQAFYDWVHPRPAAAERLGRALLQGLVDAELLAEAPSDARHPGLTGTERLEASLRMARSWLTWGCVRSHDPSYRFLQARRFAHEALAADPDNAEAAGLLQVMDALREPGTGHPLPQDPEVRRRLGVLHPTVAALLAE